MEERQVLVMTLVIGMLGTGKHPVNFEEPNPHFIWCHSFLFSKSPAHLCKAENEITPYELSCNANPEVCETITAQS